MTRINTNVSSLLAQTSLSRSNSQLQQSLTRLSTGLRINSGKDDPSGLIASENLRSDIIAVQAAIGNSERANQVIATADSALGQVSSLLNDIRGLVTESANAGALSDEQIAANQLQVDSSLESLNRIAQTTSFQGRRLLDGSLDFVTTAGTNYSEITDLTIDQANLGATGSISVSVVISAAAEQASIGTSIAVTTPGAQGTLDVDLGDVDPGEVETTGSVDIDAALGGGTGSSGEITIERTTPGALTDVDVNFVEDSNLAANTAAADFNGTDTITVRINGAAVDTQDIVDAINSLSGFTATEDTGGTVDDADLAAFPGSTIGTLTGGRAAAGTFTLETDDDTDTYNGVAVEIVQDGALSGATDPVVAELITDVNGNPTTLRFRVDGTDNAIALSAFQDALDNSVDTAGVFSISGASGGTLDGATVGTPGSEDQLGDIDDGADPAAGLADEVVFELIGTSGTETFQFDAGTTGDQIESAVNLVSDATGVTADYDSGTGDLTFSSSAYGSAAVVQVNVISEGGSGDFESGFSGTLRDTGADIEASVNGVQANGKGNQLSINTSTLDLTLSVTEAYSGSIGFTIADGGALFQLGPDVVSNQQARIGIRSVNTARLGGVSGKLFQLGAGNSASLATDPNAAALIVEEAIDQITSLRGRLGAFQKTTLETNIASLSDTLVNLTDAESQIRDADFAVETAKLTRAQILVQSGSTVLSISNSNPQNVLALLR